MAERQQLTETALGGVVLLAALAFLGYALAHAGGIGGGGGYKLTARFGEAGALAPGAAVSVAGVKVGAVTAVRLDPKTFLAEATMTIDPTVKLPVDSTVKITQDSLLGGQHLSVEPGGSLQDLKAGASFENTQGAVDLFGLIGSVLRPQSQGAAAGGAPSAGAGASAATAAPGG